MNSNKRSKCSSEDNQEIVIEKSFAESNGPAQFMNDNDSIRNSKDTQVVKIPRSLSYNQKNQIRNAVSPARLSSRPRYD